MRYQSEIAGIKVRVKLGRILNLVYRLVHQKWDESKFKDFISEKLRK